MGTVDTGVLGRNAEQQAFDYLLGRGLRPVARNFRSRGGEIDLIMLHDDCLVFVEVRYRASVQFVAAGLTVDHRKQQKIIRTAAMYLARQPKFSTHTMRFDVVAVEGREKRELNWIQDAFRPNNSTL